MHCWPHCHWWTPAYTLAAVWARAGAALRSALDDIPGVGPATLRKLMGEFGTVDAIKAAEEDALLKVVNLRVAQAIRSWAADQKD